MVIDDREYHNLPLYSEMQKVKEMLNCDFAFLSNIQKIEIFNDIEFKSTELFEWTWIKSSHIQIWMERNQRFTITTALMSMVSHIIGLGDRHPSNLTIQRETGNVCHIDFGESFVSTLLCNNFPEKVPLRLTRMIMKNLTGNCTNGLELLHLPNCDDGSEREPIFAHFATSDFPTRAALEPEQLEGREEGA